MILNSLLMKNFRQFRGEQQVFFAHPGSTPKKAVTVIFGENGRGKTGIFRALMFCLFNERCLSQDGEVQETELSLVNKQALEDAAKDGNKPTESFVEVEFLHHAERYRLRRCLYALFDHGKVLEEIREVNLYIQKADGNTEHLTDPEDIRARVEAVLDSRVREYFLFDGEKIERLTRASVQQRKTVAKGIRDLLNIGALESAIAAADKACKRLDSEIQNKSTGEHKQVLHQIAQTSVQVESIEQALKNAADELERAGEEKAKVDRKLSEFKDIQSLLEQRSALEDAITEREQELKALREEMLKHTGKASLLIVADTVRVVYSALDEKRKKGEIPPEIRRDLIDRLLAEGKCICGRAIVEGSNENECITEWRRLSADPGITDSALELWRHLGTIIDHVDDYRGNTQAHLQRYAIVNQEIRQASEKLHELNKKIGSSERKDAANFEAHRQKLEQSIIDLQVKRMKLEPELQELKSVISTLEARREKLEQDEGIKNELVCCSQLGRSVHNALRKVHEDFKDQIKTRLSDYATEVLQRLLDDQSKTMLRKISVGSDYSLQMIDHWGKPFLANISAGQRQIMSISFIAALARAAAGGELLEMPLFMDTPFGRLSFEHRRNLIAEIPQLSAQWILLATDTELRRPEGELLLKTGKWGKFYVLKSQPDSTTTIEERDVANALAVLPKDQETIV